MHSKKEPSLKRFYKKLGRPIGDLSLERRWQDVLHDKKWKRFLKMSRLFAYLPFIDFALAAGSMALGNVHKDSDFDVIVGCRSGRIFTARFFSVLTFGAFHWRRKKINHRGQAADKICFNHFITEKSSRLSPPRNIYWRELYRNLVPIFGRSDLLAAFYKANDWSGGPARFALRSKAGGPFLSREDQRHFSGTDSFIKKKAEMLLVGGFGDWVERILKNIQVKRVEKNLKFAGFQPRIKYDDEELEFHPDTRRIFELTGK